MGSRHTSPRKRTAANRDSDSGGKLLSCEASAEQIAHACELLEKGESRQYVADILNARRATLYRKFTGHKFFADPSPVTDA
jgi:hypothetical protein